MRLKLSLFAALSLASCSPRASLPPLASQAEIEQAEREPLLPFAVEGEWNTPTEPFTVIGNIHYVGTKEISAFLITSPQGHVLIDGIMAQTAPQIIANIKALGFDIRDVQFLLNSHAHLDHAGGLAALQRASGAVMVASAADKPILEAGEIGFGPTKGIRIPAVRVNRVIGDQEAVRIGNVTLTAHLTPGHTPGCTSWTMPVTGADGHAHRVLFHCSLSVAGQSLVPESYPGMIADYQRSFDKMRAIPVDILLANHADFFDLDSKRERQLSGDANAFVVPGELQTLNAELENAFLAELARQREAAP